MLLLVFFSFFPFLVLAFFDSSLLRSHFWPFTEVLRKIWLGVTRKVGKTADDTDVTAGFFDWRLTQTPYNWMSESACRVRQPRYGLRFCIRVIRAICGEFYFCADSRLLFLAELLESRIGAQRIPDGIEPKKGRRNGRCGVNPAIIGRF